MQETISKKISFLGFSQLLSMPVSESDYNLWDG